MPRILVVDDEPDICQMIRRYAEHDGYETVGVSDGTEAVAICQKEDFDIIIMDVMMPDMDGFAACRKIREQKDIPVLMLSARGEEYDLLLYLSSNKGIVLTRDKIMDAVWGYEYFGEDRTVDWQIKLLRNKLGKYREMIHTIRGVGYKFDE